MGTLSRIFLFGIGICIHVGGVGSFDIKSEKAQGLCTSLVAGPDYVYAVRRSCATLETTNCDTICSRLGKICFNSIKVYYENSFQYNSCSIRGCGPNYCCCSAKTSMPADAYKRHIADVTCKAIGKGSDNVLAVKRTCSSSSDNCQTVCHDHGKTCLESIKYKIFDSVSTTDHDTGQLGHKSYRYDSCREVGCGPNFCCCGGSR